MTIANALKQVQRAHQRGLRRLLSQYPSQAQLARELCVSPQVIQGWKKKNRISRKGVEAVLAHPTLGQKFTLADFRPELEE